MIARTRRSSSKKCRREEASRYGVCDTNNYGEITEVVEKPDDPPTNLLMTGFSTFTPATFPACKLVQPTSRGESEISEPIDLLIRSGRPIDALGLDGCRIAIGSPEDRDEAEAPARSRPEPAIAEDE